MDGSIVASNTCVAGFAGAERGSVLLGIGGGGGPRFLGGCLFLPADDGVAGVG